MMNSCDGCKWWSELVAAQEGTGPMKAMCLNPDSPCYQRMEWRGCRKCESGRPVDDPCSTTGESG